MRNVVATMLLGMLMLNTGVVLAYSERAANNDKEKVMRTLLEIREMVKQLKADQSKAPRYDAPCYGAPGTPVPCQPALDAAFIVREICCCLQELIANIDLSAIDVIVTRVEELEACCQSANDTLGSKTDVMDCDDFINLTCCDTINAKEQSVIAWLKLVYYTLNHGDCTTP